MAEVTEYQLAVLKRNQAVGIRTDQLDDGTWIGWAIDSDGVTAFELGESHDAEDDVIDRLRKMADERAVRSVVLA